MVELHYGDLLGRRPKQGGDLEQFSDYFSNTFQLVHLLLHLGGNDFGLPELPLALDRTFLLQVRLETAPNLWVLVNQISLEEEVGEGWGRQG